MPHTGHKQEKNGVNKKKKNNLIWGFNMNRIKSAIGYIIIETTCPYCGTKHKVSMLLKKKHCDACLNDFIISKIEVLK